MLRFAVGERVFQVRVAGVCRWEGKVLLHRAERDDFWTFPGGRVEVLERTADALVREMAEELGVPATVGRLLWVAETFFSHEDQVHHELGFYYEMSFPEAAHLYQADTIAGTEGDINLIYRWFALDELGSVKLYPEFARAALASPSVGVVHVEERLDKPRRSGGRR